MFVAIKNRQDYKSRNVKTIVSTILIDFVGIYFLFSEQLLLDKVPQSFTVFKYPAIAKSSKGLEPKQAKYKEKTLWCQLRLTDKLNDSETDELTDEIYSIFTSDQ